ncbi:MAG TPA: TIGR02281 family clan AA aspartic protease [Gallionella sp.]|nr:TIGR02281 family clan AA aspartic protease [Gallionella sp.]
MRNNILMFSLAVLLTSGAWAGTVYKCRNPQGDLVYQEVPCKQDAQSIKSWSAMSEAQPADEGTAGSTANGTLVIPQRGNGHYFVDGSINGKALTFVVDTGASSVVLPRPVAMAAGVYCRDQVLMQTVGGAASGCSSVVAKLRFGQFQIRDVPVMIAPNLTQPLLGMNVLQQFRIEQDGGQLRLSPRN